MQTAHQKWFGKLARHKTKKTGPARTAAAASYEVGIIVPSVLKAKLTEAGYSVNFLPGKAGSWCLVTKDDGKKKVTEYDESNPNIVARAFGADDGDALLQAVYSWCKEEYAADHTPQALQEVLS